MSDVQLTTFESNVRSVLDDCTGYSFVKRYDSEEGSFYYDLIDQYGDVDGDSFYEFDDLLDYITENSEVDKALQEMASAV